MQYQSLAFNQEVEASASCIISGYPLSFSIPVHFDVAPLQTISGSPSVTSFIPGRTHVPLLFGWDVRNWQPKGVSGNVSIVGPSGWRADRQPFSIAREDGEAEGHIALTPPPILSSGDEAFQLRTGYCSADVNVHVFDAAVAPNLRIGIIESYDNTLEEAAHILNVPCTMLDDSTISGGELSTYSSIIIDLRAYLVRNALKNSNARLLRYVEQGGTLIVMYQRDQEWKPEYAPYPFRISRRRVTMEDAPITVLQPGHPLLTTPNRITAEDWKGWTQERGLYFPDNVPPEYSRLLSCSDPDEEPLTTGYLSARYGKGVYIYTSYVWYRQLKEAHPGAFRCFANMISYIHPGE
jgi:hypothetical protein